MANLALVRAALESRLFATMIASTGVMSLASTATGYTRAAGSFVADGFVAGQEVTPSGFTNTSRCVVKTVSASLLTIVGGRTAQTAGAGRSLIVTIPALRQVENTGLVEDGTLIEGAPPIGRPYVECIFDPSIRTLTTNSPHGNVDDRGLFIVNYFGIAYVGPFDIDAAWRAVELQFPPMGITLTDGTILRIRGNPAPYRIAARPFNTSWSVAPFTIAWEVGAFLA